MKKVFKLFLYADYKNKEKWFNSMSKKGGIFLIKKDLYIVLLQILIMIYTYINWIIFQIILMMNKSKII